MNYLVIDLETTGFDAMRSSPISIGAYLLDGGLNELSQFYSTIKPYENSWWSMDAEEVHGFTREESEEFPHNTVVYSDFRDWLSDYGGKFRFVCHAQARSGITSAFDYKFMYWWFVLNCPVPGALPDMDLIFPRGTGYSTIRPTKEDPKELYGIKNQKLDTWMDRLNIDKSEHHNSLFDAKVCCDILKFQLKTNGGLYDGKDRKRETPNEGIQKEKDNKSSDPKLI